MSAPIGYTYLLTNGRLAQGSAPPSNAQLPFDVIVLAAKEYQDQGPKARVTLPGYEIIRAPLDDSGPPPTLVEKAIIRRSAREVAQRVRAGKRVLVTCIQGRNRSGVIAGLALVELGLSPANVVERIRALRDGLANPYFRAIVKDGTV